ncbi:hypothetical protein EV401DRAFT_1858317 [Pisolithus croceorrhizus]|nr:hypothetical protein EV401DRAFT_1858317 [Pisolithus croceorrhizus]
MTIRSHQHHFSAPVIPSRSSSNGSLPPGASPPLPNAPPTIPRSSSPFSVSSHTTSIQHATGQHPARNSRNDQNNLRRKSPAPAALGILKALEPNPQDSQSNFHHDSSDDHHPPSEPVRAMEKKEKRSFWEGMLKDRENKTKEREKEKERERARDRDRRDDDVVVAELTRLIGYLTATASEDWSIVLEVCERASATEANAKEAAKALRREFKYAEPKSQLAAARLWAIMLRNASDIFLAQISQRKFIETLEDVLTSSRTSPVVRERLMEVLAAAAYISSHKEGFRGLWCRLKPADKPDCGVPFDTDDAMFSPPVTSLRRPSSQYSLETPTFAQQTFSMGATPAPPPVDQNFVCRHTSFNQPQARRSHRGIIPVQEDMQRLFQECKIALGNANVLSEALAFAKPDALDGELVREFLAKCRSSQELIHTQIPWASAGAERSRAERALQFEYRRSTHGSHQDLHAGPDETPSELTMEEELLAALLDANEALFGALNMYEDLARVAVERATEERSRREVRMNRRVSRPQFDEQLGEPPGGHSGSPRTASPPLPSPPTSPRQQFEMPMVVPSSNHPLPRIPPNLMPSPPSLAQITSQHYHSQATTPTLLAPPHPIGPRSPSQPQTHSRTPSPDRMQRFSGNNSPESRKDSLPEGMEQMHIEDESTSEEAHTPIRPSEKALGKRRVIYEPDGRHMYDSCDPYGDKNVVSSFRDSVVDSDSDEVAYAPKRPPVQYVYDAAAERTAQQLKEGRVLVNGVH